MTSNNSISSLDSLADGTNEFGSAQAGSKGSSSKKSGENHTQSEDKKPAVVVLQNNPTLNDPEVEVEKVVSGPDFSKGTMDDIVLTATPMTPFMAWNKKKKTLPDPSICSRLVSVMGVDIAKAGVTSLRKFCTSVGIPGQSSTPKRKLVEAIVEATKNPPKKTQAARKNIRLNSKRLCNVLFDDSMRPFVMNRGAGLTKEEMMDGFKTDQKLHMKVMDEYNDSTKYNEDAWPNLRNSCRGDPSVFTPIDDWTKFRDALKLLLHDYEKCLGRWRKSGNHGGFGEQQEGALPFSKFIKDMHRLLYFHEFIHKFQAEEYFKKVTGQLPAAVFSESAAAGFADETDASSKTPTKKRKKTPPRKRSNSNSNSNEALEELVALSRQKTQTVSYSLLNETLQTTSKSIREQKEHQRKLLKEATEESTSCFTLSAMRTCYKDWKNQDPEDYQQASQEELFQELLDTEADINESKKLKEDTLKRIEELSSSNKKVDENSTLI